jgi:hypothetical protein
MKSTVFHSTELMKIRLSFEQTLETAAQRVTALYKDIKEAVTTEDLVLLVWIVLVSFLLYTGYCKFCECGKIIGWYKQLRF